MFERPPAEVKQGLKAAMGHYESFLSPDIGHLKYFITNVVITRIGTNTMAAQAYVFALFYLNDGLSLVWGRYEVEIRMEEGVACMAKLGIHIEKLLAQAPIMLGED